MASIELEETFLSAQNSTSPTEMQPFLADEQYKRPSSIFIFLQKYHMTLCLGFLLTLFATAIGLLFYLFMTSPAAPDIALPGLDVQTRLSPLVF